MDADAEMKNLGASLGVWTPAFQSEGPPGGKIFL
jgi:hypothetical protein